MLVGTVYKENYKIGSYHLYHFITYHYLSNHKLLDVKYVPTFCRTVKMN